MKNFNDRTEQEVVNALYQPSYKSFTVSITSDTEFTQLIPAGGASMFSIYSPQPIYYSFVDNAVLSLPNEDVHFFEGGRLSFAMTEAKGTIYFRPFNFTETFVVRGSVG